MNPCEYLHNMYSDHSWISNVWFQMAHIYNCQTLLISLLLETSLNPVAFLISSVALDSWNPCYVRGVQHGGCWYSERVHCGRCLPWLPSWNRRTEVRVNYQDFIESLLCVSQNFLSMCSLQNIACPACFKWMGLSRSIAYT